MVHTRECSRKLVRFFNVDSFVENCQCNVEKCSSNNWKKKIKFRLQSSYCCRNSEMKIWQLNSSDSIRESLTPYWCITWLQTPHRLVGPVKCTLNKINQATTTFSRAVFEANDAFAWALMFTKILVWKRKCWTKDVLAEQSNSPDALIFFFSWKQLLHRNPYLQKCSKWRTKLN